MKLLYRTVFVKPGHIRLDTYYIR